MRVHDAGRRRLSRSVPAASKPIASYQSGAADRAVLNRDVPAAVVRLMELAAKTEIEATAGLPAP